MPQRSPVPASLVPVLLAALLGALLLLLGPAAGEAAAACTGEPRDKTVTGTLVNTGNNRSPVAGVEITVENCDGEEFVGETDEAGSFSIDFTAGVGATRVRIDPDTLPEGVDLREGASTENTLTGSLSTLNTTFLIGPDSREVTGTLDRVPQLLYSGLLFGLILAMAALGLSMIFGTTGLTNFAHGELVTLGAVVTFLLSRGDAVPLIVAIPAAVLVGLGFGWLQETVLWRPLRRRGIGLIAAMIVTIGLQFFLRNFFGYITGSRFETYDEYYTPAGKDFFGLVSYTVRDLVLAAISILVLLTVILALKYSRLGRATRAVSDNPALAATTGINVDRVISLVWMIGTALAALAGSFLAFQVGVTYQIGQQVLLLLFAACCLGGFGSVWGALLGSLLIGVLLDLSTLVIDAELKNAGALIVLILILLVRPQGLLGRSERVG